MPNLVLTVPLKRGVCRWCRCTWDDPCPPGCGWVDRAQTLCSECEDFDKALRTLTGRRRAVEAFLIGVEVAEGVSIEARSSSSSSSSQSQPAQRRRAR